MYSQQRGLDTYPCQNTWKKLELISHRHFHAVKFCQVRKWIYREKSFLVILWHKSMSQSCCDGMEASYSSTVITYWFRVSSGSVHFTGALLSEWVLVCPIMLHSAFGKTWWNDGIVFHKDTETMAVSETGGSKHGHLRTTYPDRTQLAIWVMGSGKIWQPWLWRTNGKVNSSADGLIIECLCPPAPLV